MASTSREAHIAINEETAFFALILVLTLASYVQQMNIAVNSVKLNDYKWLSTSQLLYHKRHHH